MRLQDNCIFAGGQGSSVVIPFKLKEKADLSDLKAWLRTRDLSFADFANAHPGAAAYIQFTAAAKAPFRTRLCTIRQRATLLLARGTVSHGSPAVARPCTVARGLHEGASLQRRATPHLPPSQSRKAEVMLFKRSVD